MPKKKLHPLLLYLILSKRKFHNLNRADFLYKMEGKREYTHHKSNCEKMRSSIGLGFALTILLLLQIGATLGARGISNGCRKKDISVAQSQGPSRPDGTPTFTVMITNEGDSPISVIHLSCGAFSSAILVNPKIFRRLAVNDCLVNDGQPLASGFALSFTYATNFKYPLSVSSFKCA